MPERTRSLAALLRGLIDYAGLFPPAAHNMRETVVRYAGYRAGPDAAALGRLVVPAARLTEWTQAAAELSPAQRGSGAWKLTALVSVAAAARELEAVAAFNDREATGRDLRGHVDAVEVKVASDEEIRRVSSEAPPGLDVFFECAPDERLPDLLAAVERVGGAAKIRTGGLVPESIPPSGAVARFLHACVSASIPFKATAGLHHAMRAGHALTYEPDAPRAVTFGFLNVFVAAVLSSARQLDAAALRPVLEETSADAFHFDDTHLAWRELSAAVEQVEHARRLAWSFGSCSFEEPIDDLKTLHAYL